MEMRIEWADRKGYLARGMIFFLDKEEFGKMAIIEEVWVRENERHKGIGSCLIQTLLQIAEYKGCSKVILTCRDEHIPFYEYNGMVEYQNCMCMKI